MTEHNAYAYWEARQRGEKPTWKDNEPQCGYYRLRRSKDGPWLPVVIMFDEATGFALYVGKDLSDNINRDWRQCAERDVSYLAYSHCFTHGSWPGEAPTSDGRPRDNAGEQSLIEQLAERIALDKEWLDKFPKLETKLQADEAANRKGALGALRAKTDKEREAEKAPHWKECQRIDGEYNPTIKKADPLLKLLQQRIDVFDAEERARAAAAAAIIAATQPTPGPSLTGGGQPPLPSVAEPGVSEAPPPPTRYGTGVGRAVKAKPLPVAFTITDQDAVYQFHRDDPEVIALMQKLAKRCVDAGITCPGVAAQEKAA